MLPSYVVSALDSGWHWEGEGITYSIPVAGSQWNYTGGPTSSGYDVFNAAQAEQFRLAIDLWDRLVAVDFVEVIEPNQIGDIRIAFTNNNIGGSYAGYSRFPGIVDSSGDVWMHSSSQSLDFEEGSYYFGTLVHEIGHAIGLSHVETHHGYPHEEDNYLYSMMSAAPDREVRSLDMTFYVNDSGYLTYSLDYVRAKTPSVYDVAAIQSMYGTDTEHNTGDDVYSWQPGEVFYETLWDAGGNDTIDLSNQTRDNNVNLAAGALSDIAIQTTSELIDQSLAQFPEFPDYFIPQQVASYEQDIYTGEAALAIAFGVEIENVIGGSGDDQLIGNTLNNRLTGNQGADVIDGGEGFDTAVFSGSYQQLVTSVVDASQLLLTTADGKDQLLQVEQLQFEDGVLLASDQLVAEFRLLLSQYGEEEAMAQLVQHHSYQQSVQQETVINTLMHHHDIQGVQADNAEFITSLYQSVLQRVEDEEGAQFWRGILDSGNSRSSVLSSFTESAENIARLGHQELADGIWLIG